MTTSPSRIACVNLPHVAIAIAVRDQAALAGRPLAIEAPQPGPRSVHDLSYTAHLAGIARGMPLAQARKLCPELTVLPARPDAYRDTFRVMLEVLAEITPEIEPADIERSWLAATGLTARGGLERPLAEDLARRVRREVGLACRVGLAHGKLTSKIVTQYLQRRDVMILPPGHEVAFLGGLSMRYLPLEPDSRRRLTGLGLTKVHQYAALPSRGILPRFGYAGLRAYLLAHGHDDARVQPWTSEPPLEREHVFEEPIANLRSLGYHIERLAYQVARPLARQFRMAGTLTLKIQFEDGGTVERRRTLVEPAASPKVLLTHADALMAEVEWVAPVERVALAAQGLCPTLGRQLELFRHAHEGRQKVEGTLRRIQDRYGADVVQQGHRLEPESPLPERRAYLAPWDAA
jgi:DNA polymerase-4